MKIRMGSLSLMLGLAGCSSSGGSLTSSDMAVSVPVDLARATPDLVHIIVGPCDTVAQDCTDPRSKCTVIDEGNNVLDTKCEPITGSNAVGASCMRVDGGIAGFDDCVKGLFCSSQGSLNAQLSDRHCRAFCTEDSMCTMAGQKCATLDNSDGICVPTCQPFDATCPMGYECSTFVTDADANTILGGCRSVGVTPVGKPCMAATDCVTNTICSAPTTGAATICIALCNATHKCANGLCMAIPGLANGGGICQ